MKDLKRHFDKLDIFLTALVIIDILLVMVSVLFNLSTQYVNFILLFDTLICIVLIISFLVNLRRSMNKRQYFNNNWLELLASLPIGLLSLPILSSTLYASPIIILIRFLRLLLLFKVLSRFVEKFLSETYLDKIFAVSIVVILGTTLILYFFDPSFTGIFDSLWFVFQTITTVGYGDVIPKSPIGKFTGLMLLIFGVLLFSVFTASFAHIFNERIFKKENKAYNQKINAIKDNLKETKSSIDEIREKAYSNEKELAEVKENIKDLSERIDRLTDLIEKR